MIAMRDALAPLLLAVMLAAAPGAAPAQQSGWRVIEVQDSDPHALPRTRGGLLQELAGTLGAVHYLAIACDGRGAQYWRERMMALLEAEADQDSFLRAAMIEAFNDQYRAREQAHPSCTGAARAARQSVAERGLTLSEALGEAYR